MENQMFIHQLKCDSNNSELPIYDGLHFKIKKGCAIFIANVIKNGYTAQAINGTTFNEGNISIPLYTNINNVLEAPSTTDVEVVVNGKYDMGSIGKVKTVNELDVAIIILDNTFLNYYGANQENDFFLEMGGIDMNNYGFGYMEHLNRIGKIDRRFIIKNFDWESEDNGLTSKNLPNLKTFSVVPLVEVPITAYGRLTSIETLSFRTEAYHYTYGKIEDLCAILIENGKTDNFTILSNEEITLNGVKVGYDKTINCVYTNGQYVCTIAS